MYGGKRKYLRQEKNIQRPVKSTIDLVTSPNFICSLCNKITLLSDKVDILVTETNKIKPVKRICLPCYKVHFR